MSVLPKLVFRCVSIAPVLLSVPLALAQNVPPSGTSPPSANLPQTTVPNPAEGYYSGTLSNGNSVFVTIVETGEFWVSAQSPPYSLNVITGVGQASNGIFASNNATFLGNVNLPAPVALSAAYSAEIGMDVSLYQSANSAPINFSVTYDKRYQMPYPISAIAGRYNGVIQAGNATQTFVMEVYADGTLSASLSTCTLAGTAVQYSPYKNPYRVSITFTGPRCDFGNDTATGLLTVGESPGQPGNFSIGIVGTNINKDKLLYIFLAKESVSIPSPPQPPSPSTSPLPPPPPPPSTGGSVIDGGYLLE